jgi:hypothetical protein
MSESQRHDHAWSIARHIIELFEPSLPEDQAREAFAEIYVRVKAGLEVYDIMQNRLDKRLLRPGSN